MTFNGKNLDELRQEGVLPRGVANYVGNIRQVMLDQAAKGKTYKQAISAAKKRADKLTRTNVPGFKKEAEQAKQFFFENIDDMDFQGHLYKLDIPDEDIPKYLDWDKPLSEQPDEVKRIFTRGDTGKFDPDYEGLTGAQLYAKGQSRFGGSDKYSKFLASENIPGIRYLDGSSRNAGEGTYNYVTFDPSRLKVLERNGIANPGLPMDEASRMQRAREMGFDVDGYHGTTGDFSEFNSQAWISDNPDLANDYASIRYALDGGDMRLMPLVGKSGNVLNADVLGNDTTIGAFANEAYKQAIDNGANVDKEKIKKLIDEIRKYARVEESGPHYSPHQLWNQTRSMLGEQGEKSFHKLLDELKIDSIALTEQGNKTIGIRNPKNVRSKFAKFDPANKESADLLASMATMGLLGGGIGYGLMNNEDVQ